MPRCRNCKEKFEPTVFLQKYCTKHEACREAFSVYAASKYRREQKVQERAAISEMRDNVTDYKKKLQLKVQEIARLIDYGQPCLATQVTPNQIHGGHVFSRGAHSNISFNLHNIHRQSAQSNHFQSDDIKMQEGLKREYGIEYFNFVNNLKATPVNKYTNLEFKEFLKIGSGIANYLRRNLTVYTRENRIALRNKYNLELNIYDRTYCTYE